MAENSSLFLSYNGLQNVIRSVNHTPQNKDLSLPQTILAAAGAGAITSFILFVSFFSFKQIYGTELTGV